MGGEEIAQALRADAPALSVLGAAMALLVAAQSSMSSAMKSPASRGGR
jgi:hypothetical protein